MSANKPGFETDFAKVDAHVIQPEEYEELPEWTDEMFEGADLKVGGVLVRRGRPKSAAPKRPVNIRLSPQVLDHFKATGPGWQGRIDAILVDWVEKQRREG
ncbi:MAG TPA: BrnA antitoxin family protein [Azospirillaceae bacterium]|nr:BrnA antitoxin family protein [Azospirillaceae bacterium]